MAFLRNILDIRNIIINYNFVNNQVGAKGGFKSEETGGFLLLQDKYSKLLS